MKILFLFVFTLVMNMGHSQSKHSISIQSGLFHSYFDRTPLMNFNYTSRDQGLFHGVFLGSNGLRYSYDLNKKSSISLEATRLGSSYKKYRYEHQFGDIGSRVLNTFGINYNRNVALTEKAQFQYGAGISYRNGIVYQYTVPSPSSYTHTHYESNFGLSTFLGFRYYLNQTFSMYSLLDLRSVLYFVNHEELNANPQFHPGYPNRFDLSLKVGLSIHF
jgi:hypothetical protein